jgi:hypothetical protein
VNNEVSYDRWNISGMEFSWDRYGRLIIDYGTQGHLPDINQGRCLADDIVEKIVSKYNLGEFTFLETDTESVYYASTPTTYTTVYRYVSGYEGLAFLSDAYRPNFNSYDSTIDGVCIEICVSDLGISAIKLNNVSVITDAGVNQSKDILDMEDICYRTAEFLNDYQIYGNTYLFTVTATDIVYVPCQYDADGSYKGACRLDLSGVFRNNGENKQMNISVLVDLETGNIMGLIS